MTRQPQRLHIYITMWAELCHVRAVAWYSSQTSTLMMPHNLDFVKNPYSLNFVHLPKTWLLPFCKYQNFTQVDMF